MSQIWKKSKTFVPTGRIIKYPKKCARRGVPGALPAPPRGVPGHPLAAIDAFGVWTDMTWEAYTGVPRGSREFPKIPKFPENPPKIRISENPENSGKFRIFPPGPILAIFAIFAILPMDPYVGQNGGFRGILPGKGRGWGEPRGDGQGPPRPKAGYPRLAIVDGTNTPTWMTVIARMPGQLYPRFPWCPPVLRNPKTEQRTGYICGFFFPHAHPPRALPPQRSRIFECRACCPHACHGRQRARPRQIQRGSPGRDEPDRSGASSNTHGRALATPIIVVQSRVCPLAGNGSCVRWDRHRCPPVSGRSPSIVALAGYGRTAPQWPQWRSRCPPLQDLMGPTPRLVARSSADRPRA